MLITGATGNNGQELVRQLIALGRPIRALVRNPEEASGIKGPNVGLAVGDFDRPETLDTALRNINKAFLLTPAAERFVQWQVAFIEAAPTYRREASGQILGYGSGPERGFGVTPSTC